MDKQLATLNEASQLIALNVIASTPVSLDLLITDRTKLSWYFNTPIATFI